MTNKEILDLIKNLDLLRKKVKEMSYRAFEKDLKSLGISTTQWSDNRLFYFSRTPYKTLEIKNRKTNKVFIIDFCLLYGLSSFGSDPVVYIKVLVEKPSKVKKELKSRQDISRNVFFTASISDLPNSCQHAITEEILRIKRLQPIVDLFNGVEPRVILNGVEY